MFYEMVIKNPSKFTLFFKHQDREKYKIVAQNEKKPTTQGFKNKK